MVRQYPSQNPGPHIVREIPSDQSWSQQSRILEPLGASPRIRDNLSSRRLRRATAHSGSSSIAVTRPPASSRAEVRTPPPGPISRIRSPRGAIKSTNGPHVADRSRWCCPSPFLSRGRWSHHRNISEPLHTPRRKQPLWHKKALHLAPLTRFLNPLGRWWVFGT